MRTVALAIAVAILAPLPAVGDELPPGGSFLDDDHSIHQGWIEAVAAEGITVGCNPPDSDRFCPDEPVTRGQMAAFLTRATGLDPAGPAPFTDVAGSVYSADIAAIAAAGITAGCNPPANDRFCPDEPVTRGQMAAFVARAFDLPPGEGDPFDDDDRSVFAADIEAVAAAGITSGCGGGGFCPSRRITRAEMAAFLGRARGLEAVEVPPRPVVVEVTPRERWGASPPGPGLVAHDIDTITIHHAGTATGTVGPAQFRGWQRYHRGLGWPDIAYHFIIGTDGAVYEGRPFSAAGDSATPYDTSGHLLVVVEGNFDTADPTAAQVETLSRVVAWGVQRFDVPGSGIGGHRDHAATSCPGEALHRLIRDGTLTDRTRVLIEGGGVELVDR